MGAELLLAVVAVFLLLGGIAVGAGALAARRRLRAGWLVEERSTRSGDIVVALRYPGQHRVEIARIPCSLDALTFSERLAEARAEARDRAVALNAGRQQRRLGR
jgi:hypothetical protein